MHCRLGLLLRLVLPAILLVSCSAIKIETGQTREEAVASAEQQAKYLRASWAERFEQTAPSERPRLLVRYVDSVMARYVAYGFNIAEEWRQGNAGRGEEVPDTEMRRMVSIWTETQKPIMAAYEDNFEYGWDRINESRVFNQALLDLLRQLADLYYKVYSVVFYPAGTVDKYEDALYRIKRETESLNDQLEAELNKY